MIKLITKQIDLKTTVVLRLLLIIKQIHFEFEPTNMKICIHINCTYILLIQFSVA
jgi:hypothetical protein